MKRMIQILIILSVLFCVYEYTKNQEVKPVNLATETEDINDNSIFSSFLKGKEKVIYTEGHKYKYTITELLEDSEGKYLYCDIDGDGEEELHIRTHRFYYIIKNVEGGLEVIYDGVAYEYPIQQNGLLGILYYRSGGAPAHDSFQYHAFDSKGEVQEIITFDWYDYNENDLLDEEDRYHLNGESVSKQEWEEETRVYREVEIDMEEWSEWKAFTTEAPNPFFFENIVEPIYYDAKYSFADSDVLPDCIELKIIEVKQLNYGILYEMKLDYDEEFHGRDYFGWDRFHLGYFYVQEDSIYLLRNIEISEITENEEDIIKRGTLVCSNEGVADKLGDEQKGWHTYITEDGDRREYHSYNNQIETGFYETFIWEKGKGLVSYRSGFGAASDAIELQLKDDVGVWEKEFYHCAETLKESIENMHASDVQLLEYDEYVRQRRRQTYLEIWQDYMDFVESWVANDGGTREDKEEIYRMATILMVLIDDNHDANYGFFDFNRVYYEFLYNHEQTREELLFVGNQALNRENPIDSGFEQMEEEFESTDYYGERYSLTEAAWEREFYHCMELMQSIVVELPENLEELVGSSDTLEAWKIYVEQWAEWNEEYATIDAGSGLNIEIALRRKESYRTATLLMIYWLEQYTGEYTFIYDIEKDWERMIEICEE